jgi:hypothetical protein
MRGAKLALATAVLAGLMVVVASALAASAPAGGPIKVFVTPSPTGPKSKITITGAIGDFGTSLSVNAAGKTTPNGNFQKVTLKQGSFWANTTALNKATAKGKPVLNKATCSFSAASSGPVALFNGAGLYTGISGTVKLTITFAGISPRFASGAHKGRCNFNSNKIAGSYESIAGAGNVKFS